MHPIYQSLEAANPATLTSFFHELYHQLAKLARQGIDTPEERHSVEEAVLSFYDAHFASLLPPTMQSTFRKSLGDMIDATLVALAGQ